MKADLAVVLKELNVGVGIVVLDALTKREWVAEEDFAADLKIPMKVLRRVLRYLEQACILKCRFFTCETAEVVHPCGWLCMQ